MNWLTRTSFQPSCRPIWKNLPSSDSLVIKTSQEALLGDITPDQLADQWAEYLTKAQQKHLSKQ